MTTYAPGLAPTPASLLSEADLAAADEDALWQTAAAIQAQLHQRAIEGRDLEAMVEDAFASGFSGAGEAHAPWLDGGLLFAPGAVKYRSRTSHDCTFVSVDDVWVWDCDDVLHDLMRDKPGTKTHKLAITVLAANEGSKIDMVTSTSRAGAKCQMKKVRSFQVRHGQLVEVAARARSAPKGH